MKKKPINPRKSLRIRDMSLRIPAGSVRASLRAIKECLGGCGKETKAMNGRCKPCMKKRWEIIKKTRSPYKPTKQGRIMEENATTDELFEVYKDLM